MSKSLSWRRVRALCVKETRQIVRDPSSWLIAVVIPLLLLFIFGYGINLDSSKLRVGILLEQQSQEALDFTHAMTGSPYIDATISDNRHELIEKMQAGRIRGLVVIPVDFAQQMARDGDSAPIQVITDGSEPNTANFVQGYVEGIWQIWQQQRAEIWQIWQQRYFVSTLQSLFLAGNIPVVLGVNVLFLIASAVMFIGLTWLKTKRRLD
ncbi:Putative ABC-type multidrug transport system [Salmonella enterica subsp. enterica serovar Rubislaw str. A4-653]|uniref:Putative ABC-type multidrug transport system n=1 Tax=Salmonella enterica subsp. enterica serovar Rubislaw str. A4-653 TaxID=913081 RepID=G5QFW4_SALRU|nr:Putative ABC-type multidrug transport system [Salmonella enterica subsp. enterica serovar Rubislaw str. A4-653]